MKTNCKTFLLILMTALSAAQALAQGFSSGSTGADGALNVTVNTTNSLPPDGILNYTTINVAAGATLRFKRNPLNTPAYLLATDDVTINGTIDVSGEPGSINPPVGGKGGPGGFDGGAPGFDAIAPGAGYGPGGGRGGYLGGTGLNPTNNAGLGAYSTAPPRRSSTNDGSTYGSPLLVPLVGGSGGGGGSYGTGGQAGVGGSGGGGAILIASSSRITFVGSAARILAEGGGSTSPAIPTPGGSGGAVRLVAPSVVGTGQTISTGSGGSGAGLGRIRVDTTDRRLLQLTFNGQSSVGAFMMVFPTPMPRLDILEAAGTVIPEGNAGPVQIQLPFGSATSRTVTIQARDFNAAVPINVVLTPETGLPQVYPVTIDNAAANPATVTVPVTVPVNTVVTINAWTK